MVGGFLAVEERLGKVRGRKTRMVRSYGGKIDGILKNTQRLQGLKGIQSWRAVWRFLKKLKIELPCDPAIPLLGIYP